MTYKGRQVGAHRVSFEVFEGIDPGDLDVCHRCDVPPCINPHHLFLGTAQDNMRDCFQKGRSGGFIEPYVHRRDVATEVLP